jgi:hypothetical protein
MCERPPAHYDAADMDPSGGVAMDDGWLLTAGETLSFEHNFADTPGVLVLTARGLDGEPRPYVSVTVGESSLGPLLVRASSHASYSFEYYGLSGTQRVSIAATTTSGPDPASVLVQSLEIQDCWSLYGQCEGGGYYLSEISACAPLACSEPDDCTRDLPGPSFLGRCTDGTCSFPSCAELADTYPDTSFACLSFADLTDPLRNPRAMSLAGDPQSFECPAIDELTWQVDPFRGETTCVQAPVCGPNAPEELGFGQANECCYLIATLCGV